MTRAPLPPGHVRVADLVGACPVSYSLADANTARRVHPMRPRRGRPGLVPLDAPALWAAIERGEFPAPTAGPWGLSWPIEAVDRWRRQHARR